MHLAHPAFDNKRAPGSTASRISSVLFYKTFAREGQTAEASMKGAYDDEAPLKGRKLVPEKY
jgi:hypothetical protein